MTRIWTGTASVVNGDATVALTGVPLTNANCPGDCTIVLGGATYFVLSRTDGSHVELTRPYGGTTGTVAAEIDPLNANAISLVTLANSIAQYNARLSLLDARGHGLFYQALGTTGLADPGPGGVTGNSADWSTVTAFAIDVLDNSEEHVDQSSLIDTWEFGTLVIFESIETGAFAAYELSGVPTIESGWRVCSDVSYIGGGGPAPGEDIRVVYLRAGTPGVSAGMSLRFSSSNVDSDPGQGNLRINNPTLPSITAVYIDNLDRYSVPISTAIDSWDDADASVKGVLRIASIGTPGVFVELAVIGAIVDGSGYRKVSCSYRAGAGAFVNGEFLSVQFAPAGDDGDGIEPDFAGHFAGRAAHDNDAAGTKYLTDDGDGDLITEGNYLFIKQSAASGDWGPGNPIRGPAGASGVGDLCTVAMFVSGLASASEEVFRLQFTDTVFFPAALTLSLASAAVASTGTKVFSLQRNGVEFGTVTFTSSAVGVFAAALQTTFIAGDVLSVVAPASQDPTLSDISISLRGTRDSGSGFTQSGVVTIDFGAYPGDSDLETVITGVTRIKAGSIVHAWIWPDAGTADHSADEHRMAHIRLTAKNIVPGAGFTLVAVVDEPSSNGRAAMHYGRFNVAYYFL